MTSNPNLFITSPLIKQIISYCILPHKVMVQQCFQELLIFIHFIPLTSILYLLHIMRPIDCSFIVSYG
jgi:hypothetical protein